MENQYLIPANTKKGQLILGIFLPVDLAIFITGVLITIALLLIFSPMDVSAIVNILAVVPALLAAGLVFPIPNYHNVRVALGEMINFYSNNRNYKWRGWCSLYESKRQ